MLVYIKAEEIFGLAHGQLRQAHVCPAKARRYLYDLTENIFEIWEVSSFKMMYNMSLCFQFQIFGPYNLGWNPKKP